MQRTRQQRKEQIPPVFRVTQQLSFFFVVFSPLFLFSFSKCVYNVADYVEGIRVVWSAHVRAFACVDAHFPGECLPPLHFPLLFLLGTFFSRWLPLTVFLFLLLTLCFRDLGP